MPPPRSSTSSSTCAGTTSCCRSAGEYVAKQRLPLTLSALAFVFIALVVATSLLRSRLSHRIWRAVHLLTYLAWALGVVHGFLIGTDARTWWGLGVTAVSVAVVALAGAVRLVTLIGERRWSARVASGR